MQFIWSTICKRTCENTLCVIKCVIVGILLDRYKHFFSSVFCVDICGCTSGALFSQSQMKLCKDKRGGCTFVYGSVGECRFFLVLNPPCFCMHCMKRHGMEELVKLDLIVLLIQSLRKHHEVGTMQQAISNRPLA